MPISAPASSTIMPSCSVPRPISSSAHIIPCEISPLILVSFILNGSPFTGKSVAPGGATITFWPASTLGAPHTIGSKSPFPTFTVVTINLSALLCFSTRCTSPTIKPSRLPFTDSNSSSPSTSRPQSVRTTANSSGFTSNSRYSLSQLYEIFIYCVLKGASNN